MKVAEQALAIGRIQTGQAAPEDKARVAAWDRLNGETVFLYVLAAGADGERAWPADCW